MLELKDIEVSLNQKKILNSVSLQVNDGEFVSILGPSGCGKSTLLKTICGFIPHEAGKIILDDICIDALDINLRNIVMVFQDLRLFPNMLAWENVAFPMKMRGVKKAERKANAYELLQQVNLVGLENRKITQLSGGQQQRVALARAFAAKSKYLLLDEPFSGLDEELKGEMRDLLCSLHKQHRLSVIFVTHDKHEALMVSDRIAVMDNDEILQYGTPVELYEYPKTIRVARYFGERNFIDGEIIKNKFISNDLMFYTKEEDGKYIACIPYNATNINSNGIPFKVEKLQYIGQTIKITVCKNNLSLVFLVNSLNKKDIDNNNIVNLEIDFKKMVYLKQ